VLSTTLASCLWGGLVPVNEAHVSTSPDVEKASDIPSTTSKAPSNLAVRLATAFVLGPLVLWLLFYGPAWGWALFISLSAAQVAREMLTMTHPDDAFSRWVGALLAGAVAAATYVSLSEPKLFFTAVTSALILTALLPLVRLGDIPGAARRLLGAMAAPLYVGVLLGCLSLLRASPGDDLGPRYVLFTLFIAWMGDTGGYAAGRMFGKTKLYEAVSPKKTREGLAGSVVIAALISVVGSFTYIPSVPPLHAAILGVVGAVLGTMGDLVESLLKRSTGVKDSGNILPGHGGLFDRVDALLIVGPLVYLYWLWINSPGTP
jgi:phosphatidate cytidylyltransferase